MASTGKSSSSAGNGSPPSAASGSLDVAAREAALADALAPEMLRVQLADARHAADAGGAEAREEETAAAALFRAVVDGDALAKLTSAERKATAGAMACVCVGLDGDVDAAHAFLRVVVVDLLSLDPSHVDAVLPLSEPAPTTVEEQDARVHLAAETFVDTLDVLSARADPSSPEDAPPTAEIRRWTEIVGALMVACTASRIYTANAGAALQRLARAARVPWSCISALEDVLAAHLRSILTGGDAPSSSSAAATSTQSSTRTSSWLTRALSRDTDANASGDGVSPSFSLASFGRAATIGAAAALGGGLLFVTGGLAAPAMVASLSTLGAAGGVVGAVALSAGSLVAAFGGAAGISVVFGGVGAGLVGWRVSRRTEGLSQFAFLPVRGSGAGLSVFLFVPGFLRDPADLFRTWGASDGVYAVVMHLPTHREEEEGEERADEGAEDAAWGAAVTGMGMWLRRDAKTREVIVSRIDEGGAAERAGVAVGSVLTAVAVGDGPPRRVRRGDEECPADGSVLRLSRVRRILSGGGGRRGEGVAGGGGVGGANDARAATAELWLRRNLRAGADLDTLARRRRPLESRASRRKRERRRLAKEAARTRRAEGDGFERAADLAEARSTGTTETAETTGTLGTESNRLAAEEDESSNPFDSESNADASDEDSDEAEDDGVIRAVSKLSAKTFRRLTFATTRAIDGVSDAALSAATLAASATARVAGFETADGGARETEAVKLADAWPLPRGEQHVVGWEHALLMDLGGAMSSFGREAITAYVGAKAVSYTALASLAAAVAWPVTLLKSASFIDSPWALAESRAVDAGEELAAALAEKRHGVRPVTFVGYSLGAKVIFHAARALAAREDGAGLGLVQDVVLVGAPVDTSEETWAHVRRVAAGRVVNAYAGSANSNGDWMLRFLFRKNAMVVRRGLSAWSPASHPGVENVDVGDACGAHMDIPDNMAKILKRVGLE